MVCFKTFRVPLVSTENNRLRSRVWHVNKPEIIMLIVCHLYTSTIPHKASSVTCLLLLFKFFAAVPDYSCSGCLK